ncbi:MAG: rhodanese-like domain-containing protein [Anaerolineaceae bacterium]|nr:rhodanese-like domain-containing protein [Anaerolineaceae bacterium]
MIKKNSNLLLVGFLILALLISCAPVAPAVEDVAVEQIAADLPYHVTVNQTYDAMQTGDVFVLDVREQSEYDEGHIPNVNLIPMMEVQNRLDEIPKDQEVIVTCRTGNRSLQVADYLVGLGYENIHNMDGGIVQWQQAGLPVEK